MDYIVLAIPVFFILIGIELVVSVALGRKDYRLHDSVNDLSMGLIDQVGGAFLATLVFAGYLYVWDNWRLMDMGATHVWAATGFSAMVWVTCFLAKDFMYYWAHRISHEMNLGWATHIAHHQSEEFNLSVALRQGAFQSAFFWVFYLPLAFIGFPPVVYLVCSQFNTLYQFWIHTRLIGKLGPLEWVLNTPSHHRVHHGRDEKYIDKNHAGVLIVWDRMFGTFQEEEEEPNYGLVSPLKSWNPVWGQVHYLVKTARLAWAAPKWTDKLKIWFMEPAWLPEGIERRAGAVERERFQKYDRDVPLGLNLYVLLHFAAILLLATGFLRVLPDLSMGGRILGAAVILGSVLSFGGIFKLRRWALALEAARILVVTGVLLAEGAPLFGWEVLGATAARGVVAGGAAASLLWFSRYLYVFRADSGALQEETT